jgi:DNA ligase (NAD+)
LLAIEDSKQNSLEKLLFALGIEQVGEKTAKVLAKKYETMDNLMNASFEELQQITDIGEIIAKSIVDYFQDEKNKKLIDDLKAIHMNMNYLGEKAKTHSEFTGKTFVITGTLNNYTRDEIKNLIESFDGKTSGSVSKKTDVVVVGSDPGSKYDKAVQLGITIWNEEEFIDHLNNNKE